MNQLIVSAVAADAVVLAAAKFNRAQCREVLRVLRDFDQILRFRPVGNLDLTLLPHARDVGLPGFAHSANETVRASEQENMWTQSVSAGEDAQVLQDDGFKQRRHQFIGRGAHFLKTIDVGFRKHATLPSNFMELDPVVCLVPELLGRNFQLGVDLVDDCASASGALVIHGGNFLFASGLFVIFEDDDFCVLATELDHGVHLWMQLLDSQ